MSGPAGTRAVGGRVLTRPAGGARRLGRSMSRRTGNALFLIGEFVRILARGCVPGNWRRTMRHEFLLALYQIGVRAVPAVIVVALLVAIGLVAQIIYWLGVAGEDGRIGDFLAMSLVRQIGPVMTVLILIGRSGPVLVDEIGQLKLNGQLRALASYGIDPVDLIVLPLAFATAASAVLLTSLFIHTALWVGYTSAAIGGLTKIPITDFYAGVFGGLGLKDHALLVVKPAISGYFIAYLSIWMGMHVEDPTHGIRRALPKAFVYSLLATFLIGSLVSVLL